MEEIVESTLSLLSVKYDESHHVSQKILDPIHFLALVDTKAVWFKKWMVRKNGICFIPFSSWLCHFKEQLVSACLLGAKSSNCFCVC